MRDAWQAHLSRASQYWHDKTQVQPSLSHYVLKRTSLVTSAMQESVQNKGAASTQNKEVECGVCGVYVHRHPVAGGSPRILD